MRPKDEFEMRVVRCFTLCISQGLNAIEANYMVVRDFSKKYQLDSIEVYTIIKSMIGELR